MRASRSWLPLTVAAWIAVLVLLGCAGTNGGGASEANAEPTRQAVVRFTEMQLMPKEVRVGEGGIVVWTNESDHSAAVVVLPASMVPKFTCTDLRPTFGEIAGDAYQSEILRPGSEDVGLPCPLQAGSYDYELRLFELDTGDPDDPLVTLKGQIVVE